MDYRIYSIFDTVSGTYSEPFLQVNDATAIRFFNYRMQNSPMVSRDCALKFLGSFNVETGTIMCNNEPEFVCYYEQNGSDANG